MILLSYELEGRTLVRQLRLFLLIVFLLASSLPVRSQENLTIDVIGPLMVGDIYHLESPRSQGEWKTFENRLKALKRAGVDAVSTDIWWGVVERNDGLYDWSYPDKVLSIIKKVGLRWSPAISFHQLGGNVNDPEQEIPLPRRILDLAEKEGLFYVDANGQANKQVVSVWGIKKILPFQQRFFAAFLDHYRYDASIIKKIYIGMGPSGELRYISYLKDTFPKPGAIQAYSDLAIKAYRAYLGKKYLYSTMALNEAWNTHGLTFDNVLPPKGEAFYEKGEHLGAQGRDFFDFYHESLYHGGEIVLSGMLDVLDHSGVAALKNTPVAIKIPNIHWTVGDPDINKRRLAELFAGLITTSSPYFLEPGPNGAGYDDIMKMVSKVSRAHNRPVHVVFTGIEKDDGEDREVGAWSKASSLVSWVLEEAKRYNLVLDGENALPTFYKDSFWKNIDAVLKSGVKGVNFLRVDDLFVDGDGRIKALQEFIDFHLKGQMLLNTIGYVPVGFENLDPTARQNLVVKKITQKIFWDERLTSMEDMIKKHEALFTEGSFLMMLADQGIMSTDVDQKKVILDQVESIFKSLRELNERNEIKIPYKCIDAVSSKIYQLRASIYQPDMNGLTKNIKEYFNKDNEKVVGSDDDQKFVEKAAWKIKTLAEEIVREMSKLDVKDVNIELLQKMIYGTGDNSFRDGLLYYLEWKARSSIDGKERNELWYQWSTLNYLYFGLLENEEIDISKMGGPGFLSNLHEVAIKQQEILKSEVSGYRTRMDLVDRLREQVKNIRIATEERSKKVE